MASDLVVEGVVRCRVDACTLWPVLADTNRLNRAAGLEKVSLAPVDLPSAARVVGTARVVGFPVEYEELPFEWEYLRRFSVKRVFRSGPVERLEVGFELEPEGEGTRVTVRIGARTRWPAVRPLARLQAQAGVRGIERAIAEIDADLASKRRVRASGPIRVDAGALARAVSGLRATVPNEDLALVDRLEELVRAADDPEVARIRPYSLALTWGVDRHRLLATCLAAVKSGLLELRWELVCPSCRQAPERPVSLSLVQEHSNCTFCEIQFGVDFDRSVEATFAPVAAIRTVDPGPWCTGGPAKTPHVLSQAVLPAHATRSLAVPAEIGHLRLFVRGGRAVPIHVAEGAPELARADADEVQVAPGGRVEVENPDDRDRHAKLERVSWTDDAATARDVTAMPGFRRDFSTECLAPGVSLKVGRVALLFTDLTDSTRLYEEVGDAAAWRLVQDHFGVVVGAIERSRGTLVKTIGDAVMAVFADERDALVAGLAILRDFEAFRSASELHARVRIRVGVHAGACFAVNANNLLDYFGQAVNVAARLQGLARGGELVASAEVVDRVGVAALPEHRELERFDAALKGVGGAVPAVRLTAGSAR